MEIKLTNGYGILGPDDSHLGQDGITNRCLDLLDLFDGLLLVQSIQKEIDIRSRSENFVIYIGQKTPKKLDRHMKYSQYFRRVLLDFLYASGTGSRQLTAEEPAATTLSQSRSTSDDSQKTLKL